MARARPNMGIIGATELADVFSSVGIRIGGHARSAVCAGYDMPDDPACSSAALALGLWLVDAGWLPGADGVHEYSIHQGIEFNRPATLSCAVTISEGRATEVSVTGRVIPTMHGEISIGDASPLAVRAAARR